MGVLSSRCCLLPVGIDRLWVSELSLHPSVKTRTMGVQQNLMLTVAAAFFTINDTTQELSTSEPQVFKSVKGFMKSALPRHAKTRAEAAECVQECVSESRSFVTSEGTYSNPEALSRASF